MFIEPLLYISMNVQPFSLHAHITCICGSRDHINIEHAHSRYSLPKRDSISGPPVASYLNLDVALDHSATTAGFVLGLYKYGGNLCYKLQTSTNGASLGRFLVLQHCYI